MADWNKVEKRSGKSIEGHEVNEDQIVFIGECGGQKTNAEK